MNKLTGIWEAIKQAKYLLIIILVVLFAEVAYKQIKEAEYPMMYTGRVIALQYQGGFYSPDFTYVTFPDGTVLTLNGHWDLQKGETYTIDGIANKELKGITVQKIRTE